MELRHLRYFVAVAEEGSILKAASRLHLQPPPLGQQIRLLEEELGVSLFDRLPKRITLNASGRFFLDYARKILADAGHAVDVVRRFALGEQGQLRIGFTSSSSLHAITPQIMRRFRERFPAVEVEVKEHETFELILSLRHHEIDAAVLHVAPVDDAELSSHILGTEMLVVAVPTTHPMAKRKTPISLDVLSGQNFVLYHRPDGPSIFDGIMAQFAQRNIRPVVVDTVPRMIAALNLVAAGRGISIVPQTMSVLHQEYILYKPLARDALRPLPLYLIYRRQFDLELVRNFIRTATDQEQDAQGGK